MMDKAVSSTHKKPIIALDGHAASGKGTLGRALAQKLGFAYLDTGALYRYVAKTILERGHSPEETAIAIGIAKEVEVNGVSEQALADPAIRTDDVGQATSKISAIPEVRAALLQMQRDFAYNPPVLDGGLVAKGAILDGRDITTVVCPDADVKLFVTADVEIRAQRRHKELQSKGIPVKYEAVLAEMVERDARDSGRETAPMVLADDADKVDTGQFNPDEVLDIALKIVRLRTNISF